MKLALLLALINPPIGGVLIRGGKGTAKSTTVRALRSLLPELPLVTLPLHATEDMLLGGLDWRTTLADGTRRFQPGVLARADQGILYVDEINLLDDYLVNGMLDAAACGWHRVEREGISVRHASRFALVATMNPEEGDLRPHLLDRFGLCVEVAAETDCADRVTVLERREQYDQNPEAFCRQFAQQDAHLRDLVLAARAGLAGVAFPNHLAQVISELCLHHQVAGHRADLAIRAAALALAAYEQRWRVSTDDIVRVAPLVLCHRQRQAVPETLSPPDGHPPSVDRPADQPADAPVPPSEQPPAERRQPDGAASDGEQEMPDLARDSDQAFAPGEPFAVRPIAFRRDRMVRGGAGKRMRTRTTRRGRAVTSRPGGTRTDIALDATIRAAAPAQAHRTRPPGLAIAITNEDIHTRRRERRVGSLVLFLVDASGSMGAQARMIATKGAILSLLIDAYQKRDRVALITFRRQTASVTLPPTSSVEHAVRHLRDLPVGGRTPLAAGLMAAHRLLSMILYREPALRPLVILVTDGKANVSLNPQTSAPDEVLRLAEHLASDQRIAYVVVDTEAQGVVRFGLARELASHLHAAYYTIRDLKARDLIALAQQNW